jgi:hypothetical protein
MEIGLKLEASLPLKFRLIVQSNRKALTKVYKNKNALFAMKMKEIHCICHVDIMQLACAVAKI